MRFFVKLAASTFGVLGTTASAFWFSDEKRRYGVVLAATVVQTPSDVQAGGIPSEQRFASAPIQSSERWNWNWDG